jgi:hypothetical protein
VARRFDHLILGVNKETRLAVDDDLRRGAARKSNDRRAAGHGFRHDQAEGLFPYNRRQQSTCTGIQPALGDAVSLTQETDLPSINVRFDRGLEVLDILVVDFAGDD